tara:strand:+ start:19 stop:249 length:231 start_codon:yes stop_codon:yes gene_type:complete
MIKKVHSAPIDAPETGVVAAAVVACVLHLTGLVVLDPTDYGVALGAVLTPLAMFVLRIAMAFGKKVEVAVEAEEEE